MSAPHMEDGCPSEQTPLTSSAASEEGKVVIVVIPLARGLAIALLCGLLVLIQATNVSMISTTQSDIATDLDAFSETIWFTAAYLIAMSSVTPLCGRLCQILSPRVFLMASGFIMSTGLFITAIAPELEIFLLGRIVTGCGAAGVMTTTIILVLELSSRKRRGLFLGLLSASFTTGITLGAVLAGIVAPTFHWRAVYYVQAVFASIAGLLVRISIPSSRRPQTANSSPKDSIKKTLGQLDYLGVLTLTGSTILLLYSLASTDIPALPIILSIILFIAFLIVETRYAAQPIIPLTVLGSRSVLTTCFANIGFMISRWAVLFYTPIYALAVRGWPPASAGLILIPTNAGFGLGGLLVGWAHIRKADSYYTSCLVTYLLFALTFLPLSSISTPDSDVVYYVIGVFLNGFFAGALMNYTLSHLLYLTIPQTHFILTSVVAMSRGLAGSFGSAVGGGIFSRVLKGHLETGFIEHGIDEPELIHKLLGSPALVTTLTGIRKHIAVEAYEDATTTLFLAGCALTVAATAIQAGTGWNSPNNVTKNNIENLDDADVIDTEEYPI